MDEDYYVFPGDVSARVIFLGNPFLIRGGLDATAFVADNLERLASIDYGLLQTNQSRSTIGKLSEKMLSCQADCSSFESRDEQTVEKLLPLI